MWPVGARQRGARWHGARWRGAAAESQASWRRAAAVCGAAGFFLCVAWIRSASAGVGGVLGSKASSGSTLVLFMHY